MTLPCEQPENMSLPCCQICSSLNRLRTSYGFKGLPSMISLSSVDSFFGRTLIFKMHVRSSRLHSRTTCFVSTSCILRDTNSGCSYAALPFLCHIVGGGWLSFHCNIYPCFIIDVTNLFGLSFSHSGQHAFRRPLMLIGCSCVCGAQLSPSRSYSSSSSSGSTSAALPWLEFVIQVYYVWGGWVGICRM